ncbi:50S ribosomal protein L3 [bacterium]|jgi:large subunit ribosomal protein L3|nr:50S ribosomal protein L3 [bacterium]NBX78738.1 50S ribosomal protein L3 [bacterium]
MISGIWGRKIGMTQIFSDNKVVPVTVVDTSNWLITQTKTEEKDGYNAIQVGHLRKRYQGQAFDAAWLKKTKVYFDHVREVRVKSLSETLQAGQIVNLQDVLQEKDIVDATANTIGKGFQGVVKRLGYSGGRGSHGSGFGRVPGSMSFMRARGKVIKGKGLPGQMGNKRRTIKNLQVVQVRPEENVVLVKGSVAGNAGSFVFLRKSE